MENIEKIKQQNEILKSALQNLIDFHNIIGDDDCLYSTKYILVTLHNKAQKALKDANDIEIN